VERAESMVNRAVYAKYGAVKQFNLNYNAIVMSHVTYLRGL
jgi:hypothetical protein